MQALERAMAELVLGPGVPPDDRAAVDAWLERNGVLGRDAEAAREEIARLTVYRSLVRERLSEAVTAMIPRARARLGPLFDELFARFLAERGPRTHYLRDVTREFLDFLAPLAEGDARLPPWTLELARHEALDVLVGSLAEETLGGADLEPEPENALAFSATARVVRYSFAVHRLSADPSDRSEPAREKTSLFVYRSPEHDVRYLELAPLAAAILERLLTGETLGRALEFAAREEAVPLDASVVEGSARLLADLAERGALLGVRAAGKTAGDLQTTTQSAENGGGSRSG